MSSIRTSVGATSTARWPPPARAARRSASDSAAHTQTVPSGASAWLIADTRPPPPRRTEPSSAKEIGPRFEASSSGAGMAGNLWQHAGGCAARLRDLRRDDPVHAECGQLREPGTRHLEHPHVYGEAVVARGGDELLVHHCVVGVDERVATGRDRAEQLWQWSSVQEQRRG